MIANAWTMDESAEHLPPMQAASGRALHAPRPLPFIRVRWHPYGHLLQLDDELDHIALGETDGGLGRLGALQAREQLVDRQIHVGALERARQ